MTRAAVAIAIAAAVAGALGAATCAMPAFARVLRVAVAAVLAMALVAGTGLVIAQHARIVDDIERQADAFRSPGAASDSSASSRLTTGAGNRYDYWRIAVHTWRDDPLLGIGAGGYEVPYFRERVTLEDVRQPHSLPLQVLSELGLAGAVLLALFLAALGWGAVRTIRAAREATDARLLAVAGVGTATAWLVHTSVDWLHLLPGVTAVALCAAAPLMLPAVRAPATAAVAGRGRVSLLAAAAVAVTLVVAAVSLGRQALAEHFLDQGRSALAADPVQALREADRSLRIQPEGTEAYRLKAAALARYGQADASRAVLAEALGRRPEDWVTWALLGDLEVRAGNRSAAARAYGRAADLNPRDGGLRKLAERQRP